MSGEEIKMMSMIIKNNIERDIGTDERINIMSKNLDQDSVPEEYYEMLRGFNNLALYIISSLGSYLDDDITIKEVIDEISMTLNKITNKKGGNG